MSRISLLPAIFFFLATGPFLRGQTDLSPVVPTPHVLLQIEQRTPEQMDAADRQLLAERRTALDSAIADSGYDLHEGNWAYEQAVCSLFPGTMLLRYDRDAGTVHSSRFVAVLDRGTGEVRVAPTLRAGNTPFRSSYKNDNTFSIFNQILVREGAASGKSLLAGDQWVKLALCYAELSGDQPTTLLTDTLYGEAFERNVNVPIRRVHADGSVVLEFCDVKDPKATMQWDLSFDSHGRLVAVERKRRPLNSPLRQLKTSTDLFPVAKTQ